MADLMAPGSNFLAFHQSQGNMGITPFSPTGDTDQLNIYEFMSSNLYSVPYHIRTGDMSLGEPLVKKKFRDVRFYASEERGLLHVRIYIDGRYVCDGQSTCSTHPNKLRQVNIPVGRCVGYCIDIEFSGDAKLRGMAITTDPMDGTAL